MQVSFKSILKLLGFILKFAKYKRWKKRAQDADARNELDNQTHETEIDIRDKVDKVTRPPDGTDDDLLNSK